jgi:plasmid stabilization system protein ParE
VAPEQAPRLLALYRIARESVRENPLLHASIYGDYRRVVLVPFKVMVIYVTDGRDTDILAVVDGRQNPRTLENRLHTRTF